MNEIILRSFWYGILATLPQVMTRMLIKNAMGRVSTRRRVHSFMKHRIGGATCHSLGPIIPGPV
jgi:hypothetical protein